MQRHYYVDIPGGNPEGKRAKESDVLICCRFCVLYVACKVLCSMLCAVHVYEYILCIACM